MDDKELLVVERNRLSRLGVSVSIFSLLLATWARDPLLKIELPLAGANIENLTAGHAVLLGFPIVTFLFLWVAAQAIRMDAVYEALPDKDRKSMGWKIPKSVVGPRLLSNVIGYSAIGAQYFAIVVLPFIATLVLYTSFFDFKKCIAGGDACIQSTEVSTVNFLFSTELWEIRPSYLGLAPGSCNSANDCEAIKSINKDKELVRSQLPYIYAPLQSWVYSFFQLLNIAILFFLTRLYFR